MLKKINFAFIAFTNLILKPFNIFEMLVLLY